MVSSNSCWGNVLKSIVILFMTCIQLFSADTVTPFESFSVNACIGGGFKNIVFNFSDNSDLVGRVAFLSEGDETIKFRNDDSIAQFQKSVGNILSKDFRISLLSQTLSEIG